MKRKILSIIILAVIALAMLACDVSFLVGGDKCIISGGKLVCPSSDYILRW